MTEPITKEITVPVGPDRAFDIFTNGMAKWWPLDSHSLSASTGKIAKDVVITPRIGGAIIETLHDGTTADWGLVTQWKPGQEIAFTWHLRQPKAEQTLVTVTFRPKGDGTLVRLIHSDWDNMGASGQAQRDQYNSGWDLVFCSRYGDAAVKKSA